MHLRMSSFPAVLALLATGLVAIVSAAEVPRENQALLVKLAQVPNVAQPYPWLLTGGQPDAEALAAVAKAGIRDVFDLRGADEPRGMDERAVARSLKLRYLPIPTTAEDFTDSRFTAFRHHLIAHGPGKPMFIHCASGNRVGAALLPWLVLDEGLSDELAFEMARGMGLRDAELTQRAWDYIRAHERARPAR